MTRRRFIADRWTETTATLTGDQAVHLARVLRAQPGQIFDVVAGGFVHRSEITAIMPATPSATEEVHFVLHEELEADAALPLHLLIAIFKFDHLEWAIEKATELGVARITPILARRTEKHLSQAAPKRVERWRRIALEASKQSRRTSIPDVADPLVLTSALAAEQSRHRILLSELEQSTPLVQALLAAAQERGEGNIPGKTTHALAIGPEGGWTAEEMQLFREHGWKPVTLGPRILRAETAAIAAISIAGAHLG